ncbi:unnamed protein product [Caenorhabditis nigoni]
MRGWMRLVTVLSCLLLVYFVPCHSKCVMTECDGETDSSHPPCKTNASSFQPITVTRSKNPKYIARLEKYCSHLLQEENKAQVCCTQLQLEGMTKRLSYATGILGSCPSCFDNFAKLWCQFTCSPDQSRFMKVLETSGGAKGVVEKIEFKVNRDFAEGLYTSCKNTWASQNLALSFLSLGSKVSYENFYGFMGRKDPSVNIPMHTNFEFTRDKKAMNIPTTPCHKPANPQTPACGIIDCPLESYQLLDLSEMETRGVRVFEHQIKYFEWFLRLCGCFTLTMILIFALKYSCHRSPTASENCYVDFGPGSLEVQFEHLCVQYAQVVIHQPLKCVFLGLFVASLCCFGNVWFHSLTHSIDQVSAADGETRRHQKTFIETFGPTHRIEQVFMTFPPSMPENFLNQDDTHFFDEMFQLINRIQNLTVFQGDSKFSLDDICYRPLGKTKGCAIMSPTNYFQNNWNTFVNVEDNEEDFDYNEHNPFTHLKHCIFHPFTVKTPTGLSCFGEFGGPIDPALVFAGWNKTWHGTEKYTKARTFMITILLSGKNEEKAILWEAEFIKMMSGYEMKNGSFTFMTESSVAHELQAAVETDKLVSVLACASVLLWVNAMIGIYHWPESSLLSAFIHQKLLISTSSVCISVISVWCSIGIYSFGGQHATDNAIVVLFFVITLIGISRIFLTIRTFQSNGHCYGHPDITDREMNSRITDTMRRCIPIVLTNSLICSTCFFLAGGVLPYISVSMPAVEVFSRHAGLAILIDTAFYLLVILPLFQYDARREMNGRCEIWPWYQLSADTRIRLSEDAVGGTLRSPVDWFKIAIAPLILNKLCRIVILIFFSITFVSSIYWSRKLEFGFDQTMAFSKTSYLTKHFQNMNKNLNVGPPVWFVIEGDINWFDPKIQKKFCTVAGCDENSMGNTIRSLAYAENYNGNFLRGDVNIWIDSFLQFMHPRGTCCKTNGQEFCK